VYRFVVRIQEGNLVVNLWICVMPVFYSRVFDDVD
jgi:hypothetical protein